jgi:hypothetical protein
MLSDGGAVSSNLRPELVEYTKQMVGFLKGYRSGKLPLFIKKLPYFEYWEEVSHSFLFRLYFNLPPFTSSF